ncbi:hypothetical protein TIFTF001_024675 [Ficus carica]|uniref:Uncharacterized protein n=1 Tax=Ficus carica TaxID=3494 RepID=A0AA88ALR6_FICCA|nr:hypothetical protein TIFTF001_024675 [Ficus carica]
MPSIERPDKEPNHLHPEYTEHPWPAPSAEQILKPSLSKPSTLGTEYRTGLAPTSIPGPYFASNPGLGIGHVDDPPAADATHLLLSPVKSPPAANHSDGHCCPFTGDAHGTLPLTVQGLGPRGVHLLGQYLLQAYVPARYPR